MRIQLINNDSEQSLSLSQADEPILYKELRLKGELCCKLTVLKEKGGFSIRGTVSGAQEFMCSRTLEPFDRPFEVEVDVMVLAEAGITQQKEDDGSEDFFTIKVSNNQKEVDLTETVRQLVILQEPMIPVKEEV